MLKTMTLISLLFISQFSYSEKLSDAKKQVIDEMLEVTGALKISDIMGNAASKQIISALRSQQKNIDKKTITIIQNEMNTLMHEEFVANGFINQISHDIYHKHFTTAELKEIVNFYKTKAGSKLTSLLPKITQESMLKSQKHGVSLRPKINQRMQKRFIEEGVVLDK